jgi:hypothetical protein
MIYSLEQLKTAADCDVLLQTAGMEQEDIGFRKLQQERQYKNVTSGTGGAEAELFGVLSEIAGIEAVMATLPEGVTRKQFESKLVRLNYKKFILQERKDKYGVLALFEKEYEIACIERELSENQSYIDALIKRKNEL